MVRVSQRGNVFFIILIGIALFAALSMALVQMDRGAKDTKPEQAKILASRVLAYAREARVATQRLYVTNGVSEADIRFAHPKMPTEYGDIAVNPANQVFAEESGGLPYADPPNGASTTGAGWFFFGTSAAPQVGTGEADLMIVLPNVDANVCQQINTLVGYAETDAIPTDSATDCVYSATAGDRFAGTFKTGGSINGMGTTGFTVLPAMQACVSCSGTYHFYSVLIER